MLMRLIRRANSVCSGTYRLARAARISFAEQALLQDQNRFLFKVNNEAKFRRSTRSIVLGKAKVMSYEDLEEARAKRAAKETATAGKGNRGHKRKSPALEADAGKGQSGADERNARASEGPSSAMEGSSGANVLGQCC
ncbi:hypothetical protein LPUS_00860 [Lasallia pustulata]|uniref:Uncharacterized protein n=1 Tax=Lasallia pustulata TaxID=136370 RepID=A0A1W5D4G1_9LECA|nr:hypothetical protein LPUS_00860 [Lasallia pustulata]